MTIPIKNIYFMLCYAWNRLDEAGIVNVGIEDETELCDLFAKVLISGVRRCIKDGLDRGYCEVEEEGACVRGRLNLTASFTKMLFRQGRANCTIDELTTNILANQILKTTIVKLVRTDGLNTELKRELTLLARRLPEVDVIVLSSDKFKRVQIHSNNRSYRFLMNVCEVINDSLLIKKGDSTFQFRDFVEDERAMRIVFQNFVFNFYKIHQSLYKVSRTSFKWDVEEWSDASRALLPQMETDITLENPSRVVIVDTKFTQSAFQRRFDKETLKSEHLYQLFAYLKNMESRGVNYQKSEGILLYPTTGVHLDFYTFIQGHKMRACTVDLSKSAKEINAQLLNILGISGSYEHVIEHSEYQLT